MHETLSTEIEPQAQTSASDPDTDEFGTIDWLCRFYGGEDKPIHKATAWRWMRSKRIPGLVEVGHGIKRAVKAEHRAARQAMIERRGG